MIVIELVNQLDTSDSVTVAGKKFLVTLNDGLPKIYYPDSNKGEGPTNDGAGPNKEFYEELESATGSRGSINGSQKGDQLS